MNQHQAAAWVAEEFKKIQAQMREEIDRAMKESEQLAPNARVMITLLLYADKMVERLESHSYLFEATTGSPSFEDEELIKEYRQFRANLPKTFPPSE